MVSEKKKNDLERIKKELGNAKVIGLVNMRKLPARQLQKIKKELSGRAKIIMARCSLIERALKESEKKDITKLSEQNVAVPALMISKENPFKLYSYLKKNKSPAAAKVGDIATEEIIVNKGPTGIQPGPAMTTLQSVGLKTGVEGGKIAIMKDVTVAKIGDKVTPEMAAVFSMLGLEPMKIGLDLAAVWEDGTVYTRETLDIDEEQFLADVVSAVRHGLNLSINAGYITKDTAPLAIQKAFREARSLAIEANVLTADVLGDVLAKAAAEMKSLLAAAGNIEPKTEENKKELD